MAYYISIYFFPVKKNEIPKSLENWHSVEYLLEDRLKNPIQYGLRTSTSRNWWHQHALYLICKGLAIKGLDFLQCEIVCLDKDELKIAALALENVLQLAKKGIPDLGQEIEKEGSVWWLRHPDGDAKQEISSDTLRKAFEQSQAVYEIEMGNEYGYESIVNFYSFIKSLFATINECLEQDTFFLFVQPMLDG